MGKKADKDKEKKRDGKKNKAKKQAKINAIQPQPPLAGTENRTPSTEERQRMIATAAYFIAEKQGFDPSRERENWRQAEMQIEAMLKDESQGH